jgi:hypothetical protein
MDEPKTHINIVEDFCNHFCIICKERLILGCGTPLVVVSGCCVGIIDDEEKIEYLRQLKAHIWCFEKLKSKQKTLKKEEWKLKWDFKEIKPIVEEYWKKREVKLRSSSQD